MARNPFSTYGRLAKPLSAITGKTFILVPAASTLLADIQEQYPTDEDGVVRVYTDPQTCLNNCVSGRGDVVQVMPGTYTVSTALALTSVDDVHLVGVGTSGSVIFAGSAANILNLTTCKGWEIANIQFQLASTKKCIALVGCSGFNIHNNVFTSAVGGTASHFIHMLTTASTYIWIHDNQFISNLVVAGGAITQTSQITGLGIGHVIEDNSFVAGRVTTANAGAVTDGIVFAAAADAGNIVRFNSFTEFNGATFTAGLEYGTTALGGSVLSHNNNFMLATAANAIVNGSNAGTFADNFASGTV